MNLKLYNDLQFEIEGMVTIIKVNEENRKRRDYKGRNRITPLIIKMRDCLK